MEIFMQSLYTKGTEEIKDISLEKKSLFFKHIYQKCKLRFTPREFNFFRGWISSFQEKNKTLTKNIKNSMIREEK